MQGRRRIIILDDEFDVVKIIQDEVGQDFEITHFATAAQFLEFTESDDFPQKDAFVLVDIVLGEDEDGGFDAIRELNDAGIFLPVIFVSNSNLEADILRAAEIGSCAFVNKMRLEANPLALRQALAQAEGAYNHRIKEKIGELNRWGNRAIVLVGSLEHELVDITNSIVLSALALRNRCRSGEVLETSIVEPLVDVILTSSSNAKKLLAHAFSFVKGEPEGINFGKVDLVGLTRRIIGAKNYPEFELVFTTNLDTFTFILDEMKYIQIVRNLLNNAARYSVPGKKIIIDLQVGEIEVDISIRDFGSTKLTRREVRRLWEPLERGEREERGGGGGLGLTIVRQFAEMHGGRAYHASPMDGAPGNIFGIVLPRSLL